MESAGVKTSGTPTTRTYSGNLGSVTTSANTVKRVHQSTGSSVIDPPVSTATPDFMTGLIPAVSPSINSSSFASLGGEGLTRSQVMNQEFGNKSTVYDDWGLPSLDSSNKELIDSMTGMINEMGLLFANQVNGDQAQLKDVPIKDVIRDLGQYGELKDFQIGYTPEGNMYIQGIKMQPHSAEKTYTQEQYDQVSYNALTGFVREPVGRKASIFDYARGAGRMELSPIPYLPYQRDTLYDYQAYSRLGNMGYLGINQLGDFQPITYDRAISSSNYYGYSLPYNQGAWNNGFYDSSRVSRSFSRWDRFDGRRENADQ